MLTATLSFPLISRAATDWIPLFDGRSLAGWRANENAASWRVAGGLLTADGPRSHLFYAGPVRAANFKNFEFRADVLSRPGCNSGIYFHTKYQPSGFPAGGFEVQINNSYVGEGGYREHKKTGSLYGVRDVYKALVKDDTWFNLHIGVQGNRAQVRLNDVLLVDYVQPDPPVTAPHGEGRVIDRGTFALQCHNKGSHVSFKNIFVRPLPDDMPDSGNGRVAQPFGFALTDPYERLTRIRLFPKVTPRKALRRTGMRDPRGRKRKALKQLPKSTPGHATLTPTP